MDGKMLARLGAIIFVAIAIAITATVIEMTRKEEPAPARSAATLRPSADPLRDSLRRCQQLGEAAVRNPECLATWVESRDRFLGRPPTPASPQSSEGR
ncbi:conjugal transfer protein TrbK [Phyllobacterium phragmitis]|uniref:Conjugal transfer protein TrbK n=1 Tax=Phyllobacterium phragmitis TaxID=2670329 RepID=A0A2S9IJS5_9HYPH|nr:putative entry exclusion protein TrbK-alt [Phyllobacterium phragmitis]PRD40752.1 conjugal transfer protein TrbK [Phyllobacterium phragmitis]